ncbi:MAG: Amidohydrolase [Candidatus Tokpelaia hoelldobleri]|uniref:Amidohydrolase n=1 Tax=Candidatus Tokpelaia hoelldobleri TaxID=1902579 RepID=A0A1U9JX33_9HYPH|nr:MAG: Amidohydrolase [Candidatus Tokpelaia hoelldoblerii]
MSEKTIKMDKIRSHIDGFVSEMVEIRHDIHAHPELAFEEKRTSELVANLLAEWGFEVTRGFGKTGVIGTLRAGDGKKSIGLRADMDALPIHEETNLPYASKYAGKMHACGHDGHTTILLTAARYLAETKNFNGTVHLIFQPAEENFGGGLTMVKEGLFEKFPCDVVYGLHNWPGIATGTVQVRSGPTMASVDTVYVTLTGKGGHGAQPHTTVDPIVAGASIVMGLQTIVSRNVPPVEPAVITTGLFQGGTISNVIPGTVKMELTVRSLSQKVRKLLEERIRTLINDQAASFNASAEIRYERGYPVLVNSEKETAFVEEIAQQLLGKKQVSRVPEPVMGSEDFSYMLEKCPGSYLFMGTGEGADVHNPGYVFNDEIIPIGGSLWGALVEAYLR